MKEEVRNKLESYPRPVASQLKAIRTLVFSEAKLNALGTVEETLKWGEPAYLVKGGSTVRIDWKAKTPEQYAIYFNCNTILVDTFKELYGDKFRFEGNRAIVFNTGDSIPEAELRHCLRLALTYHRVKHLPLLGA